VSRDSDEFVDARREMLKSRLVLELKGEQRDDGGWGRFHSAMKSKGKRALTAFCVRILFLIISDLLHVKHASLLHEFNTHSDERA
jgi:hypothetical protein